MKVEAGGSGAALFFRLPTLAAAAAATAAFTDAVDPVIDELLFFLLVKTDSPLADPAIKAAAVFTVDPPLLAGGKLKTVA